MRKSTSSSGSGFLFLASFLAWSSSIGLLSYSVPISGLTFLGYALGEGRKCCNLYLNTFSRRCKKECIDAVIGKSYVGDWLLFYLLGQNIDSVAYKVCLIHLRV